MHVFERLSLLKAIAIIFITLLTTTTPFLFSLSGVIKQLRALGSSDSEGSKFDREKWRGQVSRWDGIRSFIPFLRFVCRVLCVCNHLLLIHFIIFLPPQFQPLTLSSLPSHLPLSSTSPLYVSPLPLPFTPPLLPQLGPLLELWQQLTSSTAGILNKRVKDRENNNVGGPGSSSGKVRKRRES